MAVSDVYVCVSWEDKYSSGDEGKLLLLTSAVIHSTKLFYCEADLFNKPISGNSCVSAGGWFEALTFEGSTVCIVEIF